MSKLKNLVRQAEEIANRKIDYIPKIITAPHTQWLEMPEMEQSYTEEAIEHVARVLRAEHKRARDKRFSPSSMGECRRKLLFGYAGVPKLGEDPDNLDLMGLGNWGHLRWQAEGISMGYMIKAEVWTKDRHYPMGGTMDGILIDGSIFELKTKREQLFNRIVDKDNKPEYEDLMQVHAYMRMSRRTIASIVYEARDSGQFHEFRVRRDPEISRAVVMELDILVQYVDEDSLPEMLPDCEMRVGSVYRRCPYRKHCPNATKVSR